MRARELKEKTTWCIFDLDGTLLTTEKRLQTETIKTILALKEKGIRYTLASGRQDKMMRHYAHLLKVEEPLISSNGAMLRDKEPSHITPIPEAVLQDFLAYLNNYGLSYFLYGVELVFHKGETRYMERFNLYNRLAKSSGTEILPVLPIEERQVTLPILKVYVRLHSLDDQKPIIDWLHAHNQKQSQAILQGVMSGGLGLDVMEASVGKGKMLATLEESLDIDPATVVVFGDEENDLGMFEQAGFTFAMGNATPAVKAAADLVAPSNNAGGVPRMLQQWIL